MDEIEHVLEHLNSPAAKKLGITLKGSWDKLSYKMTVHGIEALIEREQQRAVERFAADVKAKAVIGRAGEKPDLHMHKIIDQLLATYKGGIK